jgi:hypothetical protein
LGSGAVRDACGICGGGGASCEDEAVVSGGLALWLRADDLALSDGSPVRLWSDAAAALAATQATAGMQPAYRAGQIGGHAAVDFDGVDDRLDLATNVFSSSSFPITVFTVLRTTDSSAHVLGTGSSATGYLTSYGGGLTVVSGAPTIKANSNSAGLHLVAARRVDDGAPYLVSATASSGASEIRVDCAPGGSSTASTNAYAYGKSTIGASDGSSSNAARDPFAGSIAEVIAYQRALGAAERAAIERYLSGKYGVAAGACP